MTPNPAWEPPWEQRRAVAIKIHEIAKDGLPNMNKLTGRVASTAAEIVESRIGHTLPDA